ncbi:MAG: HEAT repeat domain-containing protein, partial [bacterium]
KLLPCLSSSNQVRKLLSIQILGRLKTPLAYEPMKRLLSDRNEEIRSQAYMALSALQADQLLDMVLTKGIKQKSSSVRKAVARCIKVGSGENLKDALHMLLKDPDSDVRIAAIETLGRMGYVSCLRQIIDDFSSCNKQTRLAVVQAMGNSGEKENTRFLTRLLKETDSDLRRVAVESLGNIKNKGSIPDLIAALDDTDWSVRCAAIQSLAKKGNQKCMLRIQEKLEDSEDIVKKEAILALGLLGCKDSVNAILPYIYNENIQMEILTTLERLGIPDLDLFYTHFNRSNTRLKCRLIDLLGRIRDQRTVDLLIQLLDENFCTIRCLAARALGELGDPKATAPLLRIQKKDPSEEVREEASRAVKKLDHLA